MYSPLPFNQLSPSLSPFDSIHPNSACENVAHFGIHRSTFPVSKPAKLPIWSAARNTKCPLLAFKDWDSVFFLDEGAHQKSISSS